MFHPHYPFVSRLPFQFIRCNKRPATMSLTNPSEESSEPVKGSERSADRSAAEPRTGSSNTEADTRPPGRRCTEEELAIHRLHRQACQVKSSFVQSDYTRLITSRRVDCSLNTWRTFGSIPSFQFLKESYQSSALFQL